MKKKVFYLLIFLSVGLFSCNKDSEPKAKYVFVFIGDGMGLNHAYITDTYIKNYQKEDGLSFMKFKNIAMTNTSPADTAKITDSGAGGTAIACGRKTQFHAIGMDRNTGEKFKSIAEVARDNGLKVGIITSVGLNHATPACFYAHVPQRSMYNEIAKQMWHSNFDFFGGGSLIVEGKNKDSIRNVFYDSLRANGYKIAFDKSEFDKLAKEKNSKIYLMDTASLDGTAIASMIDGKSRVSLADFTQAAIEHLDNPGGFFIMVEGGKIDWAAHDNDMATVMGEVKDFDKAIRVALDFYKKHPDETVIIVTADHETGGLGYGYAKTHYDTYLWNLSRQHISKYTLTRLLSDQNPGNYSSIAKKYINLDKFPKAKDATSFAGKTIDSIDHMSGIGWTTHSHTGTMIPTYAKGPGTKKYHGFIDNTFTYKFILQITGLNQ